MSEQIHRVISELLTFETQDPRLTNLTVTRADITADLRHATVFVLPHGSAEDTTETFAGLEHARNYLRHQLAQRLQLRFAPEITFALDEQVGKDERSKELLDESSKDR